MKGVPVRLEIGPRDIENGQVMIARRDTHDKFAVKIDDLAHDIPALLDDIQQNMFKQSHDFLHSHIQVCHTLDEMKQTLDDHKFVKAMWCGDRCCEDKIKEQFSATSRCMPFDQTPVGDVCPVCGKPASKVIYYARAY